MNPPQFLTILLFAYLACGCVNGDTDCFPEHRSLLLDLKHGFRLPPGQLDSWEPSSDCCGWEGITCDPKSGHVIGLDLSDRNIAGGINSHALFGLTSLQSLNMSNNEFGRINLTNFEFFPISIPQPGFEKLKELRQLDLSNGGFGGQIPNGISRLARLEYLDLSGCYMNGHYYFGGVLETRIPNFSRMIRNLNNLRVLKLGCVDLGQDVERVTAALVTSAPHLQVLDLYYTNLTGTIPESFGNLKNLTKVDLAVNKLTGAIPPSIGKLVKLTWLDLSYNSLTGPVTGSLFSLPLLQRLYLMYNQLSGELDVSLNASTSLRYIDLSYNQLCEQIPPTFFHLPSLETLNLHSNNFSGAIELDRNLAGNKLTSVIPGSIGKLVKLTWLDLSFNGLTGPVPGSLFSLPLLQILDLNYNQLSGELDVSLNASTSLREIDLSNNQLCGQIPPSFFYLPSLETLDLGSNNFSGAIELDRNAILNNLTVLELSNNSLSLGEFDDNNFLSLPNLTVLGLASCGLTKVPTFLNNQKNMDLLDLSNNRIGPDIPRWLWSSIGRILFLSHNRFKNIEGSEDMPISTLQALDLSSNMLHGPIPEVFFNLSQIEFFSAANNNLSGEIPPSICKATSLSVLDISNNLFSGSIPSCLLESDSLVGLNLGRNRLRGTIPRNITKSCLLNSLILSDNHLEGSLPRSLVNCGSLRVLDLGNNHIVDTFPFWLGDHVSLRVLSLRSNRFYGPLGMTERREANYTFPQLQVFDLSSNNFSGKLSPKSFSGLRLMMDMLNSARSPSYTQGGVPSSFYKINIAVIKGQEIQLLNILYTVVDFSNNSFEGDIPPVIGGLQGLHVLNLSHNSLTGNIPFELGNLTQLQSLDLSTNHLSGEIPQYLTSLTFLEWLNLSNNNLVGRIPQDRQFSTFSNASFQQNPELCGIPLSKHCGNAIPNITNAMPPAVISDHSSSLSSYVIGLALSIGIGYGVGLALVIVLVNTRLKFLIERVD